MGGRPGREAGVGIASRPTSGSVVGGDARRARALKRQTGVHSIA